MKIIDEKIAFAVVSRAIGLFNDQLPAARKLTLTPNTKLVGSPHLDSVDIVNLLAMIEQNAEEELGINISLFESVEHLSTIGAVVKFLTERAGSEKIRRTSFNA